MDNKVYVTQAGYDRMQAELNRLINVERPQVAQELAEARAQGDLSENADYDAAREKQAVIESQISQYRYRVEHAEIIQGGNTDHVGVGCTVSYLDLADQTNEQVTIVGTIETDPKNGKISEQCPLYKAMEGHSEGDVITVPVGTPYQIMISKIEIKDEEEEKAN